MTNTDQQLLQLTHQVQSGHMPIFDAFLLGLTLRIPFLSTQQQLDLYNSLITSPSISGIHLSPFGFLFLALFLPSIPLLLILLFVLFKKMPKGTIFPFLFARFVKPVEYSFLELTFPSSNDKSAYATEQLYNLLHNSSGKESFIQKLSQAKKTYSLELVGSKDDGIRYILVVPKKEVGIFQHNLLSFMPGMRIREVDDYLSSKLESKDIEEKSIGIIELKLSQDFALPLREQKSLSEHDPIAYLTGHMTKLSKGDLVSFQIITTPVFSNVQTTIQKHMQEIRQRMYRGQPLTPVLQKSTFDQLASLPIFNIVIPLLKAILYLFIFAIKFVFGIFLMLGDPNSKGEHILAAQTIASAIPPLQEILNPYEQELSTVVKEKIDQKLYETSIRFLVVEDDLEEFEGRMNGFLSTIGTFTSTYQALSSRNSLLPNRFTFKKRLADFRQRKLSRNSSLTQNPILSASEISDLYHFPYTDVTKTEDLVKVHSKLLPAPLSLKQNRELNVVFGMNSYGGTETPIGLTEEDREPHMFIIGRTGSGKTTLMFSMANHDIEHGEGLAFIDPHGDVAEDLLAVIPEKRKNDLIYFNPFDMDHPIGINILELTSGLTGNELELEKELVAEGVISLFRTIFNKEENADAHRIEYILRNTIYTAFTVKDPTIFTVYKLLNNPTFQKEVTKQLDNEDLKDFWKNEFGRAGDYQVVKMVAGVTAKIGRFLFSPTAKRILEQKKSTINFDQIMEEKKILICNVSQGNLGDDTSKLLGTMILSKIQQATLRRVRKEKNQRRPFYLYVDEFQNFASQSFTRMLSGGRKFGLRLIIAEQTTSQQQDHDIVNIILANTGTVICFRSANPIDEDLMLTQFAPVVERGEIINLPKYRFFIKISATEPEEPFTGETIFTEVKKNKGKIEKLIQASRNNWAIEYKPAPKMDVKEIKTAKPKRTEKPKDKEQEIKEEPKLGKLLPDVTYEFE